MDPLAVQCKKKLETFRIKELKDVLSRIGAAKQGKKQVLVEKIMAVLLFPEGRQGNPMGLKLESLSSRHSLSREDVAKVIDDIYRMRHVGASDLASNVGSVKIAPVQFPESNGHNDMKYCRDFNIQCPCGGRQMDKIIQCQDCFIWQHFGCVMVSEKEIMKTETLKHFCEKCRIQRGDPFCHSLSHPMEPAKTISFLTPAEGGSSVLQKLEAKFSLSHTEAELLRSRSCDAQIWCILLDDDVAFRMHWPLKSDLRVNGCPVRPTNRAPQQKLGANGRDDGPIITDQVGEGCNSVSFFAHDGRNFCIGVRIIKRLTLDQILARIPSEADGESFDVAITRVLRCVGGAGVGDDSDSDLEVVSENVTVILSCPMSGSRMKTAGRFKPCMHMGCFDLHTFVELNQRARKWQCPICLKNYSLNDLIIDPFFNRIANALKTYEEDVTEVEIKPDGCWRAKLEGDNKILEPWHSPYGTVSIQNKSTDFQEVLSAVKVEEEFSNEKMQTSVRLKRTREDSWHANGILSLHVDVTTDNILLGIDHEGLRRRPRSQSSIGAASNDGSSVNQQTIESVIQFPRNEIEVNSMPPAIPQSGWDTELPHNDLNQSRTPEIIILSDTEDEILNGYDLSSGRSPPVVDEQNIGSMFSCDFGKAFINAGAQMASPINGEGTCPGSTNVPLDFFRISKGHVDTSLDHVDYWATEEQNDSFQLFNSGVDVIMGLQSYQLPTSAQVVQPEYNDQCRENTMVERTYAGYHEEKHNPTGQDQFIERTGASTDQSLRIFLPHQPARCFDKPTEREPLNASSDGLQEWFSLRLGVSDPVPDPVASSYNQMGPVTPANDLNDERKSFNPLFDSESVLLDLSGHIPRADDNIFIQKTKGASIPCGANNQIDCFRIDSDSD